MKSMTEIRDEAATDWCIEMGVYNKEHFAFQAGFDYRDKLDHEALSVAVEALEWYTKNADVCFYELAGGDGAPTGYLPYPGNWDRAENALAKIRELRGK